MIPDKRKRKKIAAVKAQEHILPLDKKGGEIMRRSREEFWREKITEYEQSDLGLEEWCLEQGVSKTSFYRWRRRIASTTQSGSTWYEVADAEILPASNASTATMRLELPSGISIVIGHDFNKEMLAAVMEVLRK
ncbi:MAG: hypothetical protein PHQ55_10245 [Eubacteriales bacterium]|nr:hypothetical protein [Eubacteriales bacterium]MDD4683533.1 hypothetical protein [Eubacteriales bacterium]